MEKFEAVEYEKRLYALRKRANFDFEHVKHTLEKGLHLEIEVF